MQYKWIACVIFSVGLGFSGLAGAAQTKAVAVDAAILKLEQRLAQWNSLEAHFKQEIYGDTEELIESSEGIVHLKKPGKLRWDVNTRDKSLVLSDGKQIWHYDPELQQATVEAFNPKGTSPLMFLTGGGSAAQLGKNFSVKEVEGRLCHQDADLCVELTPHDKEVMFRWIQLGFKKEAIVSLEFLDQLGQHGWITFEKMKVNKPMSDSLFHFTPPQGTDVVRRS